MSLVIDSDAYKKLIWEDIEWLLKQPRTLERDHIQQVLEWQIEYAEAVVAHEVADLKAENVRLRKILAHVPGRVAMKAKEDAGFGNVITLATVTGECDHEWEVVDDSFDHEFGCEQIVYQRCNMCGDEREYDPPRFNDDAI